MKELLLEAKELIDAGKPEEAKAKIDEVIAAIPEQSSTGDGKPTGGGGGVGLPIDKD